MRKIGILELASAGWLMIFLSGCEGYKSHHVSIINNTDDRIFVEKIFKNGVELVGRKIEVEPIGEMSYAFSKKYETISLGKQDVVSFFIVDRGEGGTFQCAEIENVDSDCVYFVKYERHLGVVCWCDPLSDFDR